MGHRQDWYRGWKISFVTGRVDQHWSASYRMENPEKTIPIGHSGYGSGPTEEQALHSALMAAKQWIDNREGENPH